MAQTDWYWVSAKKAAAYVMEMHDSGWHVAKKGECLHPGFVFLFFVFLLGFFCLFFSPVIVAIHHLLNALSIDGLDVTCECVQRGCTQPAALQCHVSSPLTIPELRALFMPLCAAVMLRGFQHFFCVKRPNNQWPHRDRAGASPCATG